jgi:hypothetical protein
MLHKICALFLDLPEVIPLLKLISGCAQFLMQNLRSKRATNFIFFLKQLYIEIYNYSNNKPL